MRLTLSWRMAARLPSVMVSAASTDSAEAQPVKSKTISGLREGGARTGGPCAPKAAAFTPAAMKPVTGVGAPS